MKKNGFTLAEMLGVVIIIGVLALLLLPTIDKATQENKQGLYETQIKNIETAASMWAVDNRDELPEKEGDSIIIYLWQLKIGGYIDDDIRNPKNGKLFPNDMEIKITKEYNNYVYEVVEGSGTEGNTDMPDINKPVITLNGDSIISVGLGKTYKELGAKAITLGGTDVSDDIVISGTVDTSTEGTYYVKYNVTYNGSVAEEVVRTVNVIDKSPAINLVPNETDGYDKAVTVDVVVTPAGTNTISSLTYKVNGGESQTVSNNQIVLNTNGTYTLEVTAVDNEGNSKTVTSGTYKIDVTSPTITFAEGDGVGITLKDTEVASYDLKTGVTVTDNNSISIDDVVISGDLSAVAGEYTVTYTVSDEAGNTVTKTRIITVVDYSTFTEIMTDNSQVATLDPDGNLRYVGPTPNNYVSFNGELWRIIGVFNGQTKIIRNDYYSTGIKWDDDSDGSYSNNWATASLQLALNNTTDGYIKTIQTNDPTSYSYIDLTHIWNIGAYDRTFTTTGTRSALYTAERSETPAGASGSESTWKGAIGLMYPSDYGYASSGSTETCNNTVMYDWYTNRNETAYTECAEKSWLYDSYNYQWTLTPRSDYSSDAFYVNNFGYVYNSDVFSYFSVRPVLYLKSNVVIVGGTGGHDDPYKLDIKTMEDDIVAKADPSDLATNDPDGNLRYVGANPNNYVRFNNELWRIIGVFDGQTKIIKNNYYNTEIAWSTSSINDWNQSSLKTQLNETYLPSIQTNDATSYSYIDLKHIWDISGTEFDTESTRSDFYNAERSGNISTSMTSSTWEGSIGLIYASDYGYSTSGDSSTCDNQIMYDWGNYSDCYSNSWLYDSNYDQWTLTVYTVGSGTFAVYKTGAIQNPYFSDGTIAARPVLYLKSDVRIVGGLGTDQQPFILGT